MLPSELAPTWFRLLPLTQIFVICEWRFHPDEIVNPDFEADDAVEFCAVINREDWAVSGLSQAGILQNPRLSKSTQVYTLSVRNARQERSARALYPRSTRCGPGFFFSAPPFFRSV